MQKWCTRHSCPLTGRNLAISFSFRRVGKQGAVKPSKELADRASKIDKAGKRNQDNHTQMEKGALRSSLTDLSDRTAFDVSRPQPPYLLSRSSLKDLDITTVDVSFFFSTVSGMAAALSRTSDKYVV